MSAKTYTLELTAEELLGINAYATYGASDADKDYVGRLQRLQARAKADRQADELRLPWSVEDAGQQRTRACDVVGRTFHVRQRGGEFHLLTERAAKLMSAAPEMEVALDAVEAYVDDTCGRCPCCIVFERAWRVEVQPAIDRARRKVETGIPEEGP